MHQVYYWDLGTCVCVQLSSHITKTVCLKSNYSTSTYVHRYGNGYIGVIHRRVLFSPIEVYIHRYVP